MDKKIAILSLFRNSDERYLHRYKRAITSLIYNPNLVKVYAVEGDSDRFDTHRLIEKSFKGMNFELIKHDTGLPFVRRIITEQRLVCLADTANAGLDRIAADEWKADILLIIESDLIFQRDLIGRFFAQWDNPNEVLAPGIWMEHFGRTIFYDTWGFRYVDNNVDIASPLNYKGLIKNFGHYTPHNIPFKEKTPMYTVGSMVFMPACFIREGCRYTHEDAIAGLVSSARQLGGAPFFLPDIKVQHPPVHMP